MRRATIVAAASLAATACTTAVPTTTSTAPDSPVEPPQGAIPVRVVSVLDGDSVRVELSGEEVEIRMLGINAPERDECWSAESTTALAESLSNTDVHLVPDERDQFDRLLGYLYAAGNDVNRAQVVDGNALVLATEHPNLPDYLAAEEEAVALRAGMWSEAACGAEPVEPGISIWAVEPDAPGRDDRNPNGEFVAIANEGEARDIGGWMLRDESSTHRFEFPEGFVIDAGAIVAVRSGCGNDSATELFWCADGTVWTNSGDTVLLLDPSGSIVERHRYLSD